LNPPELWGESKVAPESKGVSVTPRKAQVVIARVRMV
jgi:hypothetical protein